ncbi:E3 ubiquitin-protein ligase TTC3 [Anabrus simplex]|uniref:E3 ubiquitin-protein ligase TTC3 n=1 Tax=Anabrus simplex TaxID=316456 RepID=UPI0035A2C870
MSKVDSLKELGNSYFKNKDYLKAIQCYKEGLELNPANWVLNNNIAQAYLANKNYSEAETHAVVTVALQESSVKGYYRAAKAAYNLNKPDRALTYVRKGLSVCPGSEELRALLDQLRKAKPDLANGFPEKTDDKTSGNKEGKAKGSKKDRSRSISNTRMASSSPSNNADDNDKRSTSSSRSEKVENDTKSKKKGKVNRGPIEIEDIQNDKVLKTVEGLLEEQKTGRSESDSFETIRQNLWSYMKDGSEALEKGLSRKASEKYKSAVDIIVTHNFVVFGMKELDYVILRYSLSISYIETASYSDIIKSLEYLGDIEEKHSAKLPAVYYALGNAYCKLNRFRIALEHLDKGSKVIEKGFKITTHPWPGTMTIIKETTKSGLQESLETLINYCKTYREPDAICRYKKCLEISPHIIPSEFIFYSDPDYVGYVVVICEEDCKITYHIHCWRNFKECLSPVAKLSDKDMLGRRCLTSDCVNEANEPSVIVKIEIYGDDGNIKSTCSKDPNRVNNTKENKKEKKKKIDKIVENSPSVKTKTKRKKERKTNSESSTVTMIKDVPETNTSDRVKRLQKLDALRKINFGFAPDTTFLPDAEYFGRSDIASLESFLTPEYVGETQELKNKKEFVFTYFFEYINSEGPQKIKDIEEKWKEEVSQFHGVTEFMSENEGICNFLLQSYRFAALDDYLCVASQLPETYSQVKSELSEGLIFKLGSKSTVVPPAEEKLPVTNHLDSLAPIKEEVTSNNSEMSPVPAEPTLNNDVEDKEPDEDFVSKVLNSSSEMYFSDVDDSSDSESDEEVEDEEEEVEEEDEDEHVDTKSDISSITGLNPNAQEFMPPTVQVEKFYDDLIEHGFYSNGDKKEKFVEYVSNYFQVNAADATNHQPDADNCPAQTDVAPDPEPSSPSIPPPPPPTPPPPPPEVFDNGTQTEPGRNFEEEIEKLSADVKKLHLSLTAQAKHSETLQENFERESEKFRETVKAYDAKIVALETERIKEIKNLQLEITKKDSKMDSMKKKYTEQIDKLNKKVDEDGAAYKEMETKVKDLTETVASLTTKLEDEQQHGKELQKTMLDSKKALGTSLISAYLEKCAEKLKTMKAMEKYLTESGTPSLSEMKEAIKQWEGVQKQAEMISAQFEIKYAAQSEQLQNKGRLTEALEFTASDLPKEPACPLDDMESIMHKALEKAKSASPPHSGAGGDASLLQNSHVNTVKSDARTSPLLHNPFLSSNPYSHSAQGQNLYMATNSMPYRSGTYQTSAFGAAPPFAVRIPPQIPAVMPTPIVNPVPLTGFLTNGPLILEQNGGKFPSIDKSKNVDPAEGLKPFTFEPKSTVDPVKKPAFASGTSKLEPFVTKPETSSAVKSIPVSTASRLPEKKKLSSVAGLTPIETKAAPVETKKPAAATVATMPKAVHKPQSSLNSEVKSQPTSSQKMWRYQKLLNALKDTFRTADESVLADCLAIARERNNNTLSGLTIPVIYEMVAKVLKERTEKNINGQMAMDKFGGCPWGGAKESHYDWNKPAEDLEECIICHIQMTSDVTPLQCKHTFHTECIRKWLRTNSTCPMCRKYTTLNDEFPPLA